MEFLKVTGVSARRVQLVLAFFAIYVLWGATFLAIRITVQDIPPLLASGLRFLIAGGALYLFTRVRGQRAPSRTQWRGIALTSLCMFVAAYAALFWAEQYVPSGVASVLDATLPMVSIALEVFVFRQQPFHWRLGAAVMLGFVGVGWLVLRSGEACPWLPCVVILASSVVWSIGAIVTRQMERPASLALTAGAQMMLGGVVLLALALGAGEVQSLRQVSTRSLLALLYLIVAGSIVGFTAYVWLLARMTLTRVSSHAYVNPLVALALGYFVAGEALTWHVALASLLVIASVVLILSAPQAVRVQPTAHRAHFRRAPRAAGAEETRSPRARSCSDSLAKLISSPASSHGGEQHDRAHLTRRQRLPPRQAILHPDARDARLSQQHGTR
jgi:drug/metabolite transporter (DMT)-like permease